MSHSTNNPVGLFDRQVSGDFLEASVRSLKDCYKRAHEHCRKHYPREIAHDLRPIFRRADFEREWALVAQAHSGITSGFYQNAAKNCYHIRIQCGSVILTVSYVDQRVRTVRRALFRDTYARSTNAFLFSEMAPAPPPQGAPLYAILMHDAEPKDPSTLVFADIIFPDQDSKTVGRIQLAKRFPHLFDTGETAPAEEVNKDIEIEFHEDVEKKRKSI